MSTLPSLSFRSAAVLLFAWTLVSVGTGYALKYAPRVPETAILGTTLRDPNNLYPLIDPLLGCNVGSTSSTPLLNDLQDHLQTLTDDAIAVGSLEQASIYVRNLSSGFWTGIDADEAYTPASLLKVPILITYLKQAEYNADLLSYTVTITEDSAEGAVQDIPPEESVETGGTYTIEELLSLMIEHSDNRALNVLMNYVDIDVLHESFSDLGIAFPEDAATYEVSPRLYSRFFRILYNATYLSPASSQKALLMLSKSAFTKGIRAGIPDELSVAHKFGEASTLLSSGEQGHELHDCGIFYTEDPYLLCVMTKGKNVEALQTFLQDVSEATYAEMMHLR
jgi:beta-lactamase class A